jgi:5-methylcytosine-specific restriction endonuclease McrA
MGRYSPTQKEAKKRYYIKFKDDPVFKEKRKRLCYAHSKTPKGRLARARRAAIRRGFTWEISLEVYAKLLEGSCHYCGGKLNQAGGGLDRKDSAIGYTIENVVPCCGNCNKLKNNFLTEDEAVQLIGLLKIIRGGRVW